MRQRTRGRGRRVKEGVRVTRKRKESKSDHVREFEERKVKESKEGRESVRV